MAHLTRNALISGGSLVGTILAMGTGPSLGLVIRVYSPESHDRFLNFPSTSSVANPGFIHAGVDLTGVGWDKGKTTRQVTLVSPRHFVGASHHKPAEGTQLRFLSTDGTVRGYTVAARQPILNGAGDPTDLFVGTLTADIPPEAGVGFQPYLNLATEADYVGQPLIVLGKSARGGRNTIAAFSDFGSGTAIGGEGINDTRMFTFTYSNLGGTTHDAHAEGGDSGSPSLVAVDGVGALVGTHSSVAATNSLGITTTTTFDTFVPHYIEELNAIMEAQGYHMTAVSPPFTTLAVTQNPSPGVIRAGYPFTLEVGVENTGGNDANNLKLESVGPGGTVVGSASGNNWVTSAAPEGSVEARRGGLTSSASTILDVTMTISSPGSVENEVTLSADEFAATTSVAALEVVESFRSWTAGLASTAPDSDGDLDHIGLLLEYGFGGDPTVASAFLPGTSVPLLPQVAAEGPLTVSYIVRRDAAARALTYDLEFSHDLTPGSWADASSVVTSTSVTALPGEFDLVESTLTTDGAERCFVRLRVTLGE